MAWLKFIEGIDRTKFYELLSYCPEYFGKVSISTSIEDKKLKLTFSKCNGVDQEEYKKLINMYIFFLRSQNIVFDYKAT